jgi:hypothetical protein
MKGRKFTIVASMSFFANHQRNIIFKIRYAIKLRFTFHIIIGYIVDIDMCWIK